MGEVLLGCAMNVRQLARGLEALGTSQSAPVDPVGHTFAADSSNRCQRCGVGIPAKRQFTTIECKGLASSLEDYAARRAVALGEAVAVGT